MRVYANYAEAVKAKSECVFAPDFAFVLPAIPPFPPAIPFPDLTFTLPTLPNAFACPLDDPAPAT